MKIRILFLFLTIVIIANTSFAQTTVLIDDFNGDNSIAGLQNRGWIIVDNDGGGTRDAWFQGNPDTFPSLEGPDSGYVASNFAGANDFYIDQWLISPNIDYAIGDTLLFNMRSPDSSAFPDSVTILFSQNASTNLQDFISVGQLKSPVDGWRSFFAIFGVTGPIRVAFRYLMYDGGVEGNSSDYVGIDYITLLKQPQNYPQQITLNKSFSFGDATQSSSYRLIGLPGNVNASPTQFISGEQKKDWNLFHDNGAAANFIEEFDGSTKFNFGSGRGFWVLSKNQINVNRQVSTLTLVGNAYPITLLNGWNIITNPFEKNVSLTDIRNLNGLPNAVIHSFNGNFSQPTTMVPYEGYYYNNVNNLQSLQIPYPFGSNLPKTDEQPYFVSEESLKLKLSSEKFSSQVIIGFDKRASNNFDEMDYLAPPNYFEDVSINLINQKLTIDYKNLFIEHRPEIGEGQIFNIEIKNKTEEKVTLSADGLNNFESYEIYILDERLNKLYNLREQNRVDISPIHQNNNYSLLIGSKDFINNRKETLTPKEFALSQNYPNPFNPKTVIQYSIPRSPIYQRGETGGLVTLKVYDILGNLVTTLVNNVQVLGIYEVEFDGSGLSSGMYIYEIHAGNFREVKKMSLLK
jgi:hypothetical protein